MSVFEAISLMISFAIFVLSLISLIVAIVKAVTGQKK